MKIILVIACVLYFFGVVIVIDAADKQLRGSSRALQYGSFGGYNDRPLPISTPTTPTNPNQSSSMMSFQSPEQPSQTPEDNAPVSGSNPLTFPTNLGFLLPTDLTETSIFGGLGGLGLGSGGDINFGGGLPPGLGGGLPPGLGGGLPPGLGGGLPPGLGGELGFDGSTSSGGSTGCESVRSKVRSGLVCPVVSIPVICEGGCQYGNRCKAEAAGFAANQCRPN